jgi:hypothetical protein
LEATVSKVALERARDSVKNDAEIKRLRELGQLLGRFWQREDDSALPTQPASSPAGKRDVLFPHLQSGLRRSKGTAHLNPPSVALNIRAASGSALGRCIT